MRPFEAWGQTDVTFGDLTSTTFGNLPDAGLTLDGATSPTTQAGLTAGTGVSVTFNAVTVTMGGDIVTFGYTAAPIVVLLAGQRSLTWIGVLRTPPAFVSYETLLADLAAAAATAAADEEPPRVTRALERAYQQTAYMQADGRPLDDWIRIAAALVVTMALRDADRARAVDRMTALRDVQAREWAANALEEAGA